MMSKRPLLFTGLLTLSISSIFSQCPFDATVTPNNLIMCPDDTAYLTTEVYDSYQWYKDGVLIPGATNQTLMVTANQDAGSQFHVAATLASCTENSDTVLVDGWAFLLPYVITNTTPVMTGGSGEAYYCAGTTVELILGMPYNTNITWYEGGNPIPGEDSTVLFVTQSGNYTVSGAPDLCPNFLQYLGVSIPIIIMPPFIPDWPQYIWGSGECTNCASCLFYYMDTINFGTAPVDTGISFQTPGTGDLPHLTYGQWYRAECYDSLGCLGMDTIQFIVESVEEHPFLQLHLFPNPATDLIQLYLQDDMENYQVRFMDVHGRIVKQQPLNSTIDISTLASGIYTVEVYSKKYYLRKRFIKH